MANAIRPYGPGKFSTILDAYVYSVSLDGGCDEELGDVSENGAWYGLMRHGRTIFRDHDPMLESLNETEQEQLTSSAGVIVTESSQGFVYVDYYDTDEDLNADWAAIEKEFEQEFADDEPSNDELDEDSITTPDHESFYQYGKEVFRIEENGTNPIMFDLRVNGELHQDRVFPSINAAIAKALDIMQFWPSVFFVSDHGNAHLINYSEVNQ